MNISTTDLSNLVQSLETYRFDPDFHPLQYKATEVLREYLETRKAPPEPQILIILELIPEELQLYLIPQVVIESFGVLSDLETCNGITVNASDGQEKIEIFMENIYPLFDGAWKEYKLLDNSVVARNINAVFNFGFYL